MWRAAAAIVEAVLGALFAALRIRRQDHQHDAAVAGRAIDAAALETQEIVKNVADARAGLSEPAHDPVDLARELRAERNSAGTGNRRRPF